jgi:protein TonB
MKRNTKQDKIEKQRKTFFMIGLIFALLMVFAAFEWKTYEYSIDDRMVRTDFGIIDEDFVEITKHKKPEKPKPVLKPIAAIKEVKNDQDVADVELFNPEVDQLDSVPEFVYTPPEENIEGDEEIFFVVEESPSFPGGTAALYSYLNANAAYTQMAKEANIQGTVYVGFVIEKDGSVSNVTLIRGIGGGLDEVVLEAVRNMSDWNPGKQRGVPVRVDMKLPFKFRLQ